MAGPRSSRRNRAPRVRAPRPASPSAKVGLERLAALQAVILDCDGVLTPGDLIYDERGTRLLRFDVKDGTGVAALCHLGVKVAVLSGRPTDVVRQRHLELGVEHYLGDSRDKRKGFLDLCQKLDVAPERTAFVGDDVLDLPAFKVCGLSIAVADAAPELIEEAQWVTEAKGGRGAVREVAETILKARGDWQRMIAKLKGE